MLPAQRLWGKTLGIVGLGAIGRGVARIAAGAGMRVLYNDQARLDAKTEAEVKAEFRDLPALFSEADIVALTPILTEKTRNLVGAELLGRMKPNAMLINTSRGPVLDEAALVDVLQRKAIRGAGLDVYQSEFPGPNPGPDPRLLEFENVVFTPHIGTSAEETRAWMAQHVVDEILRHMRGEKLQLLLNPEVIGAPRPATERIG